MVRGRGWQQSGGLTSFSSRSYSCETRLIYAHATIVAWLLVRQCLSSHYMLSVADLVLSLNINCNGLPEKRRRFVMLTLLGMSKFMRLVKATLHPQLTMCRMNISIDLILEINRRYQQQDIYIKREIGQILQIQGLECLPGGRPCAEAAKSEMRHRLEGLGRVEKDCRRLAAIVTTIFPTIH